MLRHIRPVHVAAVFGVLVCWLVAAPLRTQPPGKAQPPQLPEAPPGPQTQPLINDVPKTIEGQQEIGISKSIPDPAAKNPAEPTAQLRRLTQEYPVWIDSKNKQVVMDGEVCLTKGLLEMFACLKHSKEHESVVAVDTKAYIVHAALLAIGAKPGSTVTYTPEYKAATGQEIGVDVYWTDEAGKQHWAKGQDWVRNIKTKKALEFPWIFAGSGFFVDEETKKQFYLAESGDFICVSNFPSAMLDLPIESSQSNDDLMFEAFSEHIPPLGTKVKVVLTPKETKK